MRSAVLGVLVGASLAWGQAGLEYEVSEPVGWDGESPVDVVVCLHGSGDRPETFRRGLGVIAPGLRRTYRVFVGSPEARGWPLSAVEGIVATTAAALEEVPARAVVLLGYSAGGWVASECVLRSPEVFDGVVIAGSTVAHVPQRTEALASVRWWFSLGTEDPSLARSGGVEQVREVVLGRGGLDPERVTFDVLEGEGHQLSGASVEAGVAWVLAEWSGEQAVGPETQAALEGVAAAVEARDPVALRSALAAGDWSAEAARAALLEALGSSAGVRDEAFAEAAIEGLGRCGALASERLEELARRGRVRRDARLFVAVVRALGEVPTEGAAEALEDVLGRWDHDGAPQVAAAEALARVGRSEQVEEVVDRLRYAERRDRDAFAEALDAALRAMTGQELSGGRVWEAYLEALERG